MSKMTSLVISLLVIPFSAQAKLVDSFQVEKQGPPVAAVVAINESPACVAYSAKASDATVNEMNSRFNLPNCENQGLDASQINMALEVGAKRKSSQTAFLSHAVAGLIGCVYGVGMPMFFQSMMSSVDGDKSDSTTNFAMGALVGGAGIGILHVAGTLTVGHTTALAGGYVACTGGVNYLLYREINQR